MKKVFITGAAGALGRAVTAYLRGLDQYNVTPTDFCDMGDGGFQLDVCSHDKLAHAVSSIKPDWVLHLAATFSNDFNEAYAVNVEASRHLLDAVQKLGFPVRVLLVGSAAEYGAVQPNENPIREERVLNPVSIYGLTKAWQTQLAGLYANRGVDVVVARVFNLDGPGLSKHLFVGSLQKQIAELLAGRKPFIELGPLSAVRDYLTTMEAAEQILAIATHAKSGGVYHVASGIPVTMRDMLVRYLAKYGLNISVVHEAAELSNRSGYDVPAIYADVTRTMSLLKTWRSCVEA